MASPAATMALRPWERAAVAVFFLTVVVFGIIVLIRSAFFDSRRTDVGCYLRAGWAVRAGNDLFPTQRVDSASTAAKVVHCVAHQDAGREGDRLVIGGVTQNVQQKTVRKVPLMGDIPILGWLFKQREDFETGRELVVFLTPSILRTDGAQAATSGR